MRLFCTSCQAAVLLPSGHWTVGPESVWYQYAQSPRLAHPTWLPPGLLRMWMLVPLKSVCGPPISQAA
ncbi:hypothetical protein A7J05_01265 [Streptomyces alfalfae]|uniref:Uncharacterized protein n=1 Tax=Streptomyces alfalfae TaxID=1642299 RepID=A0ABN4VE85_9ACTN|nr:hypothetical protein A7J05_01265 [Streptomyces alfalfae]